ncbi:MAG: TatD family hydrolase [Puniceicoccales bacterium]|jgi:TatD DNase family protein|nr:TatD family hydrolase [Puniceicoccales bacterium]
MSITDEGWPIRWIDTHCHPDDLLNSGKIDEAWQRSQMAGVEHWIAIGTQESDGLLYANAAERYDFISYTVGVHPLNISSISLGALEKIIASWDGHLTRRGFVGVGEIGLDYSRLPESLAERETTIRLQKESFEMQLKWAVRHHIPIVLHARDSFGDVMDILKYAEVNADKVVFHCFTEGPEEICRLNACGMCASFTGIVTFKNAKNVREALKMQGIERLMIETDAPYLAPFPHRGKINEPAYLSLVAQYIAQYLGISISELARHLEYNATAFFGLQTKSQKNEKIATN